MINIQPLPDALRAWLSARSDRVVARGATVRLIDYPGLVRRSKRVRTFPTLDAAAAVASTEIAAPYQRMPSAAPFSFWGRE